MLVANKTLPAVKCYFNAHLFRSFCYKNAFSTKNYYEIINGSTDGKLKQFKYLKY